MIIVIAASDVPPESCVMKEQTGTTDQPENQFEFTYALLIRSEEKSRNIIEMAIYPILILGAVIAIWQFAQQPVNIPAAGLKRPCDIVFAASAQNNVCRDGFYTLRRGGYPEIKG